MERRFSFQQYRAVDLSLFAVMLLISETLIIFAAVKWFPGQPYTVSVTSAITAIVLMRWGPYALIHAVLGGLVFCFWSGGAPEHYLIYCVGNAFSMLSLLLIRLVGEKKIKENAVFTLGFALCTILLMQFGRATVAFLLGTPMENCVGFFTTDAVSGLFAMVICWIANRLDGIFENQKSYLLRVHSEEEREANG